MKELDLIIIREVYRLLNIDLDAPVLNAYILFVQTADAVQKYADTCFHKRVGLSSIKFIVLQILAVNGGIMTPFQIARWTLRERHNITTLVARMQQDGLVRAQRNTGDRRFINIVLTDKGQEMLKQAVPVAREIVNQIMSSFDEKDAA